MVAPDHCLRSACPPRRSFRGGFALLITVTLLAFLVLLLVSLASLTRVETQVAGNSRSATQARQNALLALNIALGQLQKFAGPDQRVTTTADLVATADKAGTAALAPVYPADTPRIAVQNGSRYWTGIWGNTQSSIGYALAPDAIPGNGNHRGVSPGLLNWLVSGNEATAFTPNGTAGGVNPGTGIIYAPGDAVDLTDLAKPTVKSSPAVVLVGSQSTGGAASDYVVAPLVPINAPAGSMPGLDPAAAPTIGRYAWWVGDEGVKARVSLQNGYAKTGQVSDQINSFITTQRSAVEFMARDASGTAIGPDYSPSNPWVPKIINPGQLPFISTTASVQANLAAAAKTRFHDITGSSFGLLSDTYAGGLKKDLTADIADTSSDFSYRPADSAPVFVPVNSSEPNLPTWGLVRSWARTNPVGGEIDPASVTARQAGINPIIAYASLGFGYYFEGNRPVMAFYPFVVLHNPYPVPIKAANYDLGIRFNNYSAATIPARNNTLYFEASQKLNDDPLTYSPYAQVGTFSFNTLAYGSPAGSSDQSFFRFKIQGESIAPGQRQIYLLKDFGAPVYGPNAITLNRVDPSAPGAIGINNYFIIPGPSFAHPYLDSGDSLVRLIGTIGSSDNSGTNPYSLRYAEVSTVLAESGSLGSTAWDSSTTAQTHWYQAMVNVFPLVGATMGVTSGALAPPTHPFINASNNATVGNGAVFCSNTAFGVGERLSTKTSILMTAATSALRLATPYEGRNFWSSISRAGLTSSTGRFIAAGNLRAPYIQASRLENGVSSIANRLGAVVFGYGLYGGVPDSRQPHPFVTYDRGTIGFGTGPDVGTNPASWDATRYAILYDVLDTPDRLLSVGQLQHVPFSRHVFQPGYVFGNSYANIRVARTDTYRASVVQRPSGTATSATADPVYDLSWHLNRAVWDRYFVSGVPSTWTQADLAGKPLPNSRMTALCNNQVPPALQDVKQSAGDLGNAYNRAAARLLVAGGFNINSTSEQAWRAVLAGSSGLEAANAADYATSADGVATAIPHPRFSHNMAALLVASGGYTALPSTMTLATLNEYSVRDLFYASNRGLYLNRPTLQANTSAQSVVAELARSIVNEIRARGPFLSLSDFVNRPLVASGAGIKGALTAGIDNMDGSVAQVNPHYFMDKTTSGRRSSDTSPYPVWDSEHYLGVEGSYSAATSSAPYNDVSRAASAMAPGFLTQADILSSLGPQLTARSDTFTIRTYGESLDPVNSTPANRIITARAWCEAVVQRLPDYMDPASDAAEKTPVANGASTLSSINQQFGRKFKIVSFRWLTPSDI